MIQNGFLTKKTKRDSKNNHYASIASKSILYLGIAILISALIYMIANFAKADMIVRIWFPFMISGVFLIFISQMIKWKYMQFDRLKNNSAQHRV